MAKILVDVREKNSLVVASLIEKGFEVELKTLKVADYILQDIAIERKTVSDFISSMIDKRLSRQLQEIKQYEKRLLLIEGNGRDTLYDDSDRGVHANAIRGMLLSCLLDYNVPIVMTKDFNDTASFISVLANRLEKPRQESNLRVKKFTLNPAEQQQMILEGFPGIGPKTAKAMLKNFRSIKSIINASEQELRNMGKLDDKKIKKFMEIVNRTYR